MKRYLAALFLMLSVNVVAQFNNSWIDYSKTYYKFKLATDNLYRIPQSAFTAAGIGATNANHFQLWRNGKQVRLYTSVSNAPLGASDFVEFWGEMNDGKPDIPLYRNASFQLADKYSLETDTSAYFLTINPAGGNLRYSVGTNSAPITGTPDAYYMRTVEKYYRDRINRGAAITANVYVYSASYDEAEGWSSAETGSITHTFNNLNIYNGGPQNNVEFKITAAGTAPNTRNLKVILGTTEVVNTAMSTFQFAKVNLNNMPLSNLGLTNSVTVTASTTSPIATDRICLSSISLKYPSTFDFNGAQNFAFELAPAASGNNLEISNFSTNSLQPVLLDITNGIRYLGNITAVAGKVQFVLPPSVSARSFILISQDAANIKSVDALKSTTFVNFGLAANQGDYVIISNKFLFNDGSGNNYVDQYRQYRSSVAGGGYNAKVIDVEQLTDQFAFGIKNHPDAVRNFAFYLNTQSIKPKYFFLIGRGMNYESYRASESNPLNERLALVPTFGYPAGDNLLTSIPGQYVQTIPVARLSVVHGSEVKIYLDKVKQYENVQATLSPTIADKRWMKHMVFTSGGKDPLEYMLFRSYSEQYKTTLQDTLFGGKGWVFSKTSSGTVQPANNVTIDSLINTGIGILGFFGHSSQGVFDFSLNDPNANTNASKYYLFNASGCSAGNFFDFYGPRLSTLQTLSEQFVLANQRGSIGFMANTHYGFPQFLDEFNTNFYRQVTKDMYGNTIGNQLKRVSEIFGNSNDIYYRVHGEEILLHGDPAIKINAFPKPDYVIEDQYVKISPTILSVADTKFSLSISYYNLGKATGDSIKVFVKRKLPNGTVVTLYDKTVLAVKYEETINLEVPINPLIDKGLNQLQICIDYTNKVDEIFETNNCFNKDFYVLENELRPIYPYNYAIVNTNNITFAASTANAMAGVAQYQMELDTTELFNSAFKKSYSASGPGGLVEFKPGQLAFTDSTVYYWRVSIVPQAGQQPTWNTFSFTYIPTGGEGFNQSHYFQYKKDSYSEITLDNDRVFRFFPRQIKYSVRTAIYPYAGNTDDFSISVDGNVQQSGFMAPFQANVDVLRFYVIDGNSGQLWFNRDLGGGLGLYGSYAPLPFNTWSKPGAFHFDIRTSAARQKVIDFINLIPNGASIVMCNPPTQGSFLPSTWTGDTLYQMLRNIGFTRIDEWTTHKTFTFVTVKGSNVATLQDMGAANIVLPSLFEVMGRRTDGYFVSDVYGPSSKWERLKWKNNPYDAAPGDKARVEIIGITNNNTEVQLGTVYQSIDTTIAWINAAQYPRLKLRMQITDSANATPTQLRYWMVTGKYVPEGALAPSILFNMPDTIYQGDPLMFAVAFKNVSKTNFDSLMRATVRITDQNNISVGTNIPPRKILLAGDTLIVNYAIQTQGIIGKNSLFLDVNPNNHQPEQFHFNNVLYKDFLVMGDKFHPLLDVTFDGVHILNRDIVSAKPHILIKLKDENRYLALSDTSLLSVKILFPGESTPRRYHFNTDTMRFIPANLASGENTATIELNPALLRDGEYQLIVSGKDANGNVAGDLEYKVSFVVYNKPMISDMLTYPNPFTTSTAFVFTITGATVPEQLRIQILTITGKVVREINKSELGPLHIGRNITEYKWDGTDQYGDKLANGVYLYRVVTKLNGQTIEKFDTGTDKYFDKGYGKIYLMR